MKFKTVLLCNCAVVWIESVFNTKYGPAQFLTKFFESCGINWKVDYLLNLNPKKSYKAHNFFIISYVFVIFINNFIKPGAGWVLVGDRDVLLTRLWSENPTHDSIQGYYGSIMNFPSSLGVLLCEPRPDLFLFIFKF